VQLAAPAPDTLCVEWVRSLLFVDLREFGGEGPTKPSRETKELGGRLAELIHEKFPAAKVMQGKRFSGALAH